MGEQFNKLWSEIANCEFMINSTMNSSDIPERKFEKLTQMYLYKKQESKILIYKKYELLLNLPST